MSEIDKLEEIARAATPGPWDWTWDGSGQPGRVGKTLPVEPVEHCGYDSYCVALTHDAAGRFDTRANAEHIAAFNPERVLALLAVVRAAKQLSAVSGLRAEYMQDELYAITDALAAFDALEKP